MPQEERFRRQYPRREFNRKIGVLYRGDYFVTDAYELGEGGIGFRTEFVLEKNHLVILSLQIPNGEFVCVRGGVRLIEVKQNEHLVHYGVSFENINFTHRRQIRSYVSARGS